MLSSRLFLATVTLALLPLSAFAAAIENPVDVGSEAKDLTFKDVWYLPRSLQDIAKDKVTVLVFTMTDCPATQHYLPALLELEKQYRPENVQFAVVNVGPEDSIQEMAAQALELEVPVPLVKDVDQSVIRSLGVTKTPTAVILDREHRLQYRGAIADNKSTSKQFTAALNDVVAGRTPESPETQVAGTTIPPMTTPEATGAPTFADHVAPILRQHCQDCHRPDTEAPFSLISYDDAAGYADMIIEVTSEGRMPPWYASHGDFVNARKMSAKEKNTLARWVETGMAKGDLTKLPEPPSAGADGWLINEPDLVITMLGEHRLPADGYVPYKYKILPYVFKHDTWVQEIEIRPSNPRVVHHCNMASIAPGQGWVEANFVTGKVPGVQPMQLRDNLGYCIPKGARLLLQIHYTTTGQEEKCKIEVGFRFAREVINKKFQYLWMVNNDIAIPPGDPMHRVSATNKLNCNAVGIGLFAHMHLRGRDMSFIAHYPDGRSESMLVIPNYSFDWQMGYQWPKDEVRFPKGTVIECVSHYDNSEFNPYNPDPTVTVKEGQQTFDEMLNGVMFYYDEDENLGLHIDPKTGKVIDDKTTAKTEK